jgi:SAM-dependent methyltransferase
MLHGDFLSDLRAAIPPGSTILETGCGGGQDAAELVRSGYRYVGVDVSCGMLDASARAFTGGDADDPAYGRILLCQAEGEQLPFRKGMFDAALIVSALHHMRRPDRCLAQIAHCLRPGGILVAGSEPNSWPYTIRRLRRSRWGRRLGLHRQTYFPPRDGSPADFEMAGFSRSELASMFRGQGFDVLSMKSFWHLSALSCLLPRLPRVVEERICVPVDRVLSGWPVCRSWGMHWNVVARLHRAGGAA